MKNNRSEKGSILMEYVILNLFIVVGLVVLMAVGFYNFEEGYTDYEIQNGVETFYKSIDVFQGEDLVITSPGVKIKRFFQRILTGIALPIP